MLHENDVLFAPIERIDWSGGALISHPHCLGKGSIPMVSHVLSAEVVQKPPQKAEWSAQPNT